MTKITQKNIDTKIPRPFALIGNPPYRQIPKGLYSERIFPYSEGKDRGKQNLYKVFIEAAYNFAQQNGIVSLIVQSSLMGDMSAKHTRELILKKTTISKLVEFPKSTENNQKKVFKNVLQGTCIIDFLKTMPKDDHQFRISIGNDLTTVSHLRFEAIRQADITRFYPEYYEIPLIRPFEAPIVSKVKNVGHTISEYLIDTAQGNINTIHLGRIQSPKQTGAYIAKGIHIHRWNMDNDLFDSKIIPETQKIFAINEKQNLVLSQNISGTTDKHRINACPFECRNTRIVFLDSVNILYLRSPGEMKYICAVLNSTLIDWLFRITSTNNHLNMYELVTLPIPMPSAEEMRPIVKLVDHILNLKNEDSEADITLLETEIDRLVFHLYGLTEEEIAIVEATRRKQ